MEKEIVIYRYRDMIYSASQNMIYAGGEFSFIRFRGSVTPPHQAACGVLVKVTVL